MLAGLAGCGVFDAPPACPQVNVLKQARQFTLYGDGPGRDPSNVAFVAEIGKPIADCDHDIDEETGGGVHVSFDLPIVAARGPAAESDRLSVRYFVALTDGQREIFAKEVFATEIVFGEGADRAGTAEAIEQWIPLGPGVTGGWYETLIGFQLSEEQLEDAQRRSAR